MISKAICYSTAMKDAKSDSETTVFFEGHLTHIELKSLLGVIWNVDPITVELYNLNSENELVLQALGASADGDLRLLEKGCHSGGGIAYHHLDDKDVLLLLGPESKQRLVTAQNRMGLNWTQNGCINFSRTLQEGRFVPLNPCFGIAQFTHPTIELMGFMANYPLTDAEQDKAAQLAQNLVQNQEREFTLAELVDSWEKEETLVPFCRALKENVLLHRKH